MGRASVRRRGRSEEADVVAGRVGDVGVDDARRGVGDRHDHLTAEDGRCGRTWLRRRTPRCTARRRGRGALGQRAYGVLQPRPAACGRTSRDHGVIPVGLERPAEHLAVELPGGIRVVGPISNQVTGLVSLLMRRSCDGAATTSCGELQELLFEQGQAPDRLGHATGQRLYSWCGAGSSIARAAVTRSRRNGRPPPRSRQKPTKYQATSAATGATGSARRVVRASSRSMGRSRRRVRPGRRPRWPLRRVALSQARRGGGPCRRGARPVGVGRRHRTHHLAERAAQTSGERGVARERAMPAPNAVASSGVKLTGGSVRV